MKLRSLPADQMHRHREYRERRPGAGRAVQEGSTSSPRSAAGDRTVTRLFRPNRRDLGTSEALTA